MSKCKCVMRGDGVVVEGIGRQLDPELDLLREAGPFLARAVVQGAREGW